MMKFMNETNFNSESEFPWTFMQSMKSSQWIWIFFSYKQKINRTKFWSRFELIVCGTGKSFASNL